MQVPADDSAIICNNVDQLNVSYHRHGGRAMDCTSTCPTQPMLLQRTGPVFTTSNHISCKAAAKG